MEFVSLISFKDKQATLLCLDVNEEVDGVENIIDSAVKKTKCVNDASSVVDLANKCKARVNFKNIKAVDKGVDCVIESPTTKKLLATKALTIVMICENLIGDRVSYICSDISGNLYNLKAEDVINMLTKRKGFINNAFVKNGGLQLTQGNYIEKTNKNGEKVAIPVMPVIKVGKAMTVEKKLENAKSEKINIKDMLKYSAPVRAMIQHGFIDEVKNYKLYNNTIPEDNLWFYFALMKTGRANIIPKMLTSQEFEEEQLEQISLGIMDGVNVKSYADPAIPASKMKEMREAAKKGMFLTSMPKRITDIQIELNKDGWKDRKKAAQLDQVRVALNKAKKQYK